MLVRAVVIDLSSQASVRKAAKEIEGIVKQVGNGRGIDVLFNNAAWLGEPGASLKIRAEARMMPLFPL